MSPVDREESKGKYSDFVGIANNGVMIIPTSSNMSPAWRWASVEMCQMRSINVLDNLNQFQPICRLAITKY